MRMVDGIAIDGYPMATMSRASGLGCATSKPSMRRERHQPAAGRRRLPQHAIGVLLHERPGRTDEAGSTSTEECIHMNAGGPADAPALQEQRMYTCYAGRARGASTARPLGRSASCK